MTTDTREALAALVAAHDALQARSWPGGPAQYEQQRDELRAAWANARAALATQPAQPVAKMAPVQGWPAGIPWSLHLEAYAEYCKRHGAQPALIDLEGRNCRGGFGVRELDSLIPGWRDRCGEIADLKAEVARLNALLAAAPRPAQPRPCGDCRKADSWGIPLSRTCQYDCKYEPLNKPSSKERAETLLQVSALGRAAHLVSNERGDDLHTPANDTAAQPSAQGEAVEHPSHQTVRDWMPVNEALRLADVWSVGDLDNCGQWRAAIKVLADEVRALASAPAAPAHLSPMYWLASHCRALGMVKKSDSGLIEHDIALFVADLKDAAAPAQAVPLNFDQLQRVMSQHFGGRELTDDEADSAEAFARAIERAHGIAPKAAQPQEKT